MSRWALIQGGVVATVVTSDAQPARAGQWVAADSTVRPGYIYTGAVFLSGPPAPKRLTQRAFWRRFTPAEREALHNMLATGTQVQKNKLNAFRDYVLTGMNVELDDDYIIASVTLMEAANILAAGRANTILTNTVQESER